MPERNHGRSVSEPQNARVQPHSRYQADIRSGSVADRPGLCSVGGSIELLDTSASREG